MKRCGLCWPHILYCVNLNGGREHERRNQERQAHYHYRHQQEASAVGVGKDSGCRFVAWEPTDVVRCGRQAGHYRRERLHQTIKLIG